eukprot:scaffold4946_cov266-Prasinococcus_capsulatus_cf.AAC.2
MILKTDAPASPSSHLDQRGGPGLTRCAWCLDSPPAPVRVAPHAVVDDAISQSIIAEARVAPPRGRFAPTSLPSAAGPPPMMMMMVTRSSTRGRACFAA